MLLQAPHGLVTGNQVRWNTMANVIIEQNNYYTGPGSYVGEGPGASDLIFENNDISKSYGPFAGVDGMGAVIVTSGVIGSYAGPGSYFPLMAESGAIQNVLIKDNVVENVGGPGFFIGSAKNVTLKDNSVINSNLMPFDMDSENNYNFYGNADFRAAIIVSHSYGVDIINTSLSGSTTGGLSVDTTTVGAVSAGNLAPR